MFFNISNHPLSSWSYLQLKAAEKLGGKVVDIPFPEVPPDLIDVEQLAKRVVNAITDYRDVMEDWVAMVQGEHVLTHTLVNMLTKGGIKCYAATSERISVNNNDGTKTTKFVFCQFRPY